MPFSLTERISNVSLVPSPTVPVEERQLNLSCNADGSVFTRLWLKFGNDLNLTGNVTLVDSDRVLFFTSLTKQDNGIYVCSIRNPISNGGATYVLDISCM